GTEGAKGFVPGQGAVQFRELVIAPRTGKIIHDPETFLRVFRLKLNQLVSVKIRIALRVGPRGIKPKSDVLRRQVDIRPSLFIRHVNLLGQSRNQFLLAGYCSHLASFLSFQLAAFNGPHLCGGV
ncbi:MAG: hypothetical protein IJQ00_03870, partial [Kiritimatiellae bacterium]|nr:hypothetical protein [Kiritimatiellia bacterium]